MMTVSQSTAQASVQLSPMPQKPIRRGRLKCGTFGRNQYRPGQFHNRNVQAKCFEWEEKDHTIPYNDHSLRVGAEPANTRKHVFKISRLRQVPLARKASATFAYTGFASPSPSLLLSTFACPPVKFAGLRFVYGMRNFLRNS